MKRILIVGSKGFLGSHILSHLTTLNYFEVWGCDVINDYNTEKYFLIDASTSDFEEVFQSGDISFCINCSGSASVPDSLLHPLRDYYLNTVNVFKLLEAIRKYTPSCKFINISSAAVYGNPCKLPIMENASLNPLSPYGEHKLQAERICMEYYNNYNIQTCSLRVFSAYGNGLKKQLFWDISQKTKGNSLLELFGTGNESRDFIHVQDIARVIEIIINHGVFNGMNYNVANGQEITTKLAAELLLQGLCWSGELKFNGNQRAGDPLNWKADISRLNALGYSQTVTIEKGLNMYAEWLREEKLV